MTTEKNVVKNNKLIHARYFLTPTEFKVLTFIASQITPYDKELKMYRISIQEFVKESGLTRRDLYNIADDLTENLHKKILKIKDENKDEFVKYNFISKSKYKNGCLQLGFHPDLREFLLQIKEQYTKYDPKNIYMLKSFYSIRMYEFLKSKMNQKKWKVDVESIRLQLGMELHEGRWSKYDKYKDFKKRILMRAQRDLFKHTDVRFEFEERRYDRKVSELVFFIYPNKVKENITKETLLKEQEITFLIKLLPLAEQEDHDILDLIKNYHNNNGMEYVKSNIIYSIKYATKNFKKYFIDSLEKDFGLSSRNQAKQFKIEIDTKKEEEQQKIQIREEEDRMFYSKVEEYKTYFNGLDYEERKYHQSGIDGLKKFGQNVLPEEHYIFAHFETYFKNKGRKEQKEFFSDSLERM